MRIEKVIVLLDGSKHSTKQQAERHLSNTLCNGACLDLFENIANHPVAHVRAVFIERSELVEQVMQIVRELKEVEQIKDCEL